MPSLPLTAKLSEHFTFEEMTWTSYTHLQAANREVPPEHLAALRLVCAELLEPIRRHFGKPVIVKGHSGYRSKELNAAIPGSSKTSQHCKGEAVDFHVQGVPLQTVFDWIRKESGLRWGQVIIETGKGRTAPSWIHLSLPRLKTNQQVLRFDGSRYHKVS